MENGYKKVVAVVPSLNPDEKLAKVVKGLLDVGFEKVITVDDGSSAEHKARFAECAAMPGVTLLVHEVNKGKGAAMKTAFDYILKNMPDALGAVTVDGDAQHHPEDCMKCAKKMVKEQKVVLGVRDFSQEDVPFRSKAGNRITCAVFRIFCGMKLTDTQTGLRAFPQSVLPQMLRVQGERYEYETKMLLDFKTESIPYTEEVIRTIYIEENQTSHYRVVRDSFRVYKMILEHFFKYLGSSILAYVAEVLVLYLVTWALGGWLGADMNEELLSAIAFLIARAVSSFLNFNINYKLVFKTHCGYFKSFWRYYALCIPVAIVGSGLYALLENVLGLSEALLIIPHALVQVVLTLITYTVQRNWVYKKDRKKDDK